MNINGETDSHRTDEAGWPRRLLRGFNRWRRKHWLGRVVILLVIFSPVLYEKGTGNARLIRLVQMGIRAKIVASEPGLTHTLTRRNEARRAHRLQQALRLKYDSDGSGSLEGKEVERAREAGLRPTELEKRCFEADLSHLLAASQQAGLIPRNLKARGIGRRALLTARRETERHARPYRRKIDRRLAEWGQWPDYTKAETWKRGGRFFLRRFLRVFNVWWVAVCCLAAFGAAASVPRYPQAAGTMTAVAVVLAGWWLLVPRRGAMFSVPDLATRYKLVPTGLAMFYGGLGLGAARLVHRDGYWIIRSLSAAFVVGVLVMLWPVITTGAAPTGTESSLPETMVGLGAVIAAGAAGGGAWLWWSGRLQR